MKHPIFNIFTLALSALLVAGVGCQTATKSSRAPSSVRNTAMYDRTLERVKSNTKLVATLSKLGYSNEQFAEEYARQTEVAQNLGLDLSLGTLAICLQGEGRLVHMGMGAGTCITFFNKYEFELEGTGVTADLSGGIGAIYFRTKYRDQKQYCFKGASIALNVEYGAGVRALGETKCEGAPDRSGTPGWFLGVNGNVGFGVDLSWAKVRVTHTDTFDWSF